MKKIYTIAILAAGLLFAGKANAQMDIHLGYAPESWSSDNSSVDLNSFFVGVDYNMNLSGDFNISVGGQLRYGTESGSSSFYGLASGEHTTALIGIDVPILFNYTLHLAGDLGLSVFVGPKVSYTVSGKTKYKGNVLGIGGSTESDWFNDEVGDLNMKPLNLSATFGLAFVYQQFRLFGGYNYGLLDVDNNDNDKTTISGPFFGLGMAF